MTDPAAYATAVLAILAAANAVFQFVHARLVEMCG